MMISDVVLPSLLFALYVLLQEAVVSGGGGVCKENVLPDCGKGLDTWCCNWGFIPVEYVSRKLSRCANADREEPLR